MSVLNKMLAAGSKNDGAQILSETDFFTNQEQIKTKLPILNVAFSGDVLGGLSPGLTLMIGESKTFKSALSLYCVKAYLDAYPEAVCVFYDNEFGITPKYIKSFGIDPDRIIHIPIKHAEHLKFDLVKKLNALEKGDKAIFFLDSLGMLPSKKELEDAVEEKSVADMSRAKALKSMFRLITPLLNIKSVPCIMVNHTYESMNGLVATTVNSGGKGATLSPNNIFNITKAQEKDGTDLVGWKFTINIFKSRTVREKAKFPFTVMYKGGINKHSGLLDIAIKSGHVANEKVGWYKRVDLETGEILPQSFRKKEIDNNDDFWNPILESATFQKFVKDEYCIANDEHFNDEDVTEMYDTLEEDD